MISIKHLTAGYGGGPVLEGIDLHVAPGQLTVLVGQNGSGKSTLLSCVGGNLSYTGELLVNGRNLRALSGKERAQCLSLLPQHLRAVPLTVGELVSLGREPHRGLFAPLSPEDHRRIHDAMARIGVESLEARRVDTLSGGERQRAYLAMVLAQDTPVLLLDEPTASLDLGSRGRFFRLLKELCGEGKTVLAVLHDLSEAVRYGDRITVLRRGTVGFTGSAEEFVHSEVPPEVFGVRAHTFSENGVWYTIFE